MFQNRPNPTESSRSLFQSNFGVVVSLLHVKGSRSLVNYSPFVSHACILSREQTRRIPCTCTQFNYQPFKEGDWQYSFCSIWLKIMIEFWSFFFLLFFPCYIRDSKTHSNLHADVPNKLSCLAGGLIQLIPQLENELIATLWRLFGNHIPGDMGTHIARDIQNRCLGISPKSLSYTAPVLPPPSTNLWVVASGDTQWCEFMDPCPWMICILPNETLPKCL